MRMGVQAKNLNFVKIIFTGSVMLSGFKIKGFTQLHSF